MLPQGFSARQRSAGAPGNVNRGLSSRRWCELRRYVPGQQWAPPTDPEASARTSKDQADEAMDGTVVLTSTPKVWGPEWAPPCWSLCRCEGRYVCTLRDRVGPTRPANSRASRARARSRSAPPRQGAFAEVGGQRLVDSKNVRGQRRGAKNRCVARTWVTCAGERKEARRVPARKGGRENKVAWVVSTVDSARKDE